jgi:dihydrofolate reductase
VMGATTYEQVLGFGEWPYPGKPSYVLTTRPLVSDRSDITFIHTLDTALAEIQHRGFNRVWIVGGSKLASLFMQHRLIDDYIVSLIPIILGSGISLYSAVPEQQLMLIDTKRYASGALELWYQPKRE